MTEAKAARKAAKLEKQRQRLERAATRPLNRFFHHIDRGSTAGREIGSGLLMAVLAVCGVFMNMQLVTGLLVTGPAAEATVTDIAANGEIIAQYYSLSMLVAFIGTLAMGLIARLPLTQLPSLGLSTVLISTLGVGAGLTYQNLLAVCFVSALAYVVLMAVPAVRRAILRAIPAGVRRAAPAAVGLLLFFTMMQMTGIVQLGATELAVQGVNSSAINMKKWTGLLGDKVSGFSLFDFKGYNALGYKGDSYYPWIQAAMLGAVAVSVAYLLLRRTKHPVGYALLAGTGVYFMVYLTNVVFYIGKNGSIQFELDSLWGRLWMVGSEDAQQLHLPLILKSFSPGAALRQGFDFSAYTEAGGSVPALFVTGALTFLLTSLAQTDAVAASVEPADERALGRALVCNAGMNVLAPLAGIAPVAVDVSGAAGKRDGARSGLSEVVASLVLLVSAFVWLIPFIFCTTTSYDLAFNLYGHYGAVLQMMADCSFIVVDGVMALVGLMMAMDAVRGGFDRDDERMAFAATVAGALLTGNLAFGVGLGMAAHLAASLPDRARRLTAGNVLAAAVGLAVMAATILL